MTTIENISKGVAQVLTNDKCYNISIEHNFMNWIEDKTKEANDELTNEEREVTGEITADDYISSNGKESLIIQYVGNEDWEKDIVSIINCCDTTQEYNEKQNICTNCGSNF